MLKLRAITLGCSKNDVDTEHLLAQLPPDEFTVVGADDVCRVDIVLINTCGFIWDAKQESVNAILEQVRLKKDGLVGRIAVFGCLSQRYRSELESEIPEVDAWFGARDITEVLRYLGCGQTCPTARYMADAKPYAYLKISEGCDRRCSYCAIPMIRGAHRSVPMETLLEEAESLAGRGVKELILIAQDTTCYGIDIYRRRALAELLESLSRIDGIEWIRIHYSYPEGFPDDALDVMASNPKICPYLDVPLQHINTKVLSNMHRGVTSEMTYAFINAVRARVPGVALRTTVIVGHPGEGEEEFGELLDFVSSVRFERLGAFRYSEEEGTWGAANLEDDVPQDVKDRRYDTLMELQSQISLECNRKRVGTVERVLVDSCSDGYLVCRSRYESPDVDGEILVEGGDPSMVGGFINVKITEADEYDLKAQIVR